MPDRRSSPLVRYGIAVAAVIAATLARLALGPVVGDRSPFVVFLPAVVFAAWMGGFGPSTLAVALSWLAIAFFFLEPKGSLAIQGSEAWAASAVFVVLGLLVGAMGGAMRLARLRAEASDHECRRLLAAEQEVRERLDITLRSLGDAVIATDASGRVTAMNPVAESLTGWRAAEAAGKSLEEVFRIVSEPTGEPVESPVAKVLRTGLVVGLANHTALIARDGTPRPIDDSASPIRDGAGAIRGVVLVFRDDSERRAAETLLMEGEARKSAILEAALDAIITIDHLGRVVEFNPAAEAIFGRDLADVIGRELGDLIIPPRLRDAHRRGMAHYLATGEGPVLGRRIELPAMRANGTEFPVELAITRIAASGPPLFTAYLRDITERHAAEVAATERNRLAEFGRDIGLVLTEGATIEEMLERCAEATVRHLDGAFSRIWTVDDSGEWLDLRASAGMYTHLDGPHSRIKVGQYKIGAIARDRKPHLTNAVVGDPLVPAQEWAVREGLIAFAGYPLIVDDHLVGVWAMFARHPLSDDTLRAVESVAHGIALGIERKRVANAVAQSEAWLGTTLRSIGDAVIATDREARVRFMNPIAEALTGWAEAQAAGRPMEEVFLIINEETRDLVEHPVARVLREGRIVGLANHTVLIARDGTERPIEDSAAPIRDDRGEVAGVVMVFRDVTEERAADLMLQRSNAAHRTILESITDAFFALDREWRYTYVNRQGEMLMGLDRSAVLGKSLWEVFPEAIGTEFDHAYRRAMAENVTVRFEAYYPPQDRWYELHAYPSEEGLSVYYRDVSDRKQVEDALRQSERQFRALAESMPQLAWMARPDGHIYWYNKRWHDYTGKSPEEMAGWGWQEVHDPQMLPRVLERWRASIASGEPFDMEFPLRGADGGFRQFLTRVMPVRTDDGTITHWFGTNTDITDRRRMEDELRAAKEDAERADKAKNQFLAVLSHELRTPLNPILLAASSMLESPAPPEEVRPTLEMIRHNVTLQSRLIDDLLDVMRIVQGKMPLHWAVADCHAIIHHAVQVCQSEVFGRTIRLSLELAAKDHHANADGARLEQVFWNLIKNAVKFSPEGGELMIRTRNTSDGQLVIEVQDTGIGIDAAVLPMIFDPFQQGETSITRKFGGLGLGLAISRGVVEAHGGTITAESPGQGLGTTFRVVLGALASPAAGEVGTSPGGGNVAPPARPPSRTLNILVVEDEVATQRLMARLLRRLGHGVETAGTIADAIAASELTPFDLIVSDIGLPDGSGLELMRRVVAHRGKVPSIALTGYGMEEDIRRSRDAGFTAHMTKPIDFSKLESLIRQVAG